MERGNCGCVTHNGRFVNVCEEHRAAESERHSAVMELRAQVERPERDKERLIGQTNRFAERIERLEGERDAAVKAGADVIDDLAIERARAEAAEADAKKWRRIRTPTHGSCCTCQACGKDYDSCRCDLDELADELSEARTALAAAREAKDGAYDERNRLVALLASVYPSVLARHPEEDAEWEDDWRWIVFITLPTGQATWHLHDSQLELFDHVARSDNPGWDGHTTEEKYERVARAALTEGGDDDQ